MSGLQIVTFGCRLNLAALQVQRAGDRGCRSSIIPYGSATSRWLPIGEIVSQVRAVVAAGYREVVLSGVDITAFGAALPGRPTLGQLVRRLLALVPDLPRLRLSSLDPSEIDDDLWPPRPVELRLPPHLHLWL